MSEASKTVMIEAEASPLPAWFTRELCCRSLKLATLAHDNEARARQIVMTALDRFDTTENQQVKTLIHRVKKDRQPTKLILVGPPLLHRLILKTSDEIARTRERDLADRATEDQMGARYLQYLVFLVLTRSSRWAACGIGQLVYAYRNSEIKKMADSIRGDDYDDRKRQEHKVDLMSLLRLRFEGLTPVFGNGGDNHFEPHADQDRCSHLVSRVLATLSPWELDVSSLTAEIRNLPKADWQELSRCRRLIHPHLFVSLVAQLGMVPPSASLRFPRVLR